MKMHNLLVILVYRSVLCLKYPIFCACICLSIVILPVHSQLKARVILVIQKAPFTLVQSGLIHAA